MRIFLFFMLLSVQGFGQNALIPFEFERHSPSYYEETISELNADFSNEREALEFYMLAYKLQRASSPEAYFVKPNAKRNLAREYIHAFHSSGFSLALIEFLESGGSTEATVKLAESKTEFAGSNYYKYLSAKILRRDSKVNEVLLELDKSNLISPVTVAFGINAVLSSEGKSMIITQGFQDMLAVDYGLLKTGKQNVRVLNFFLESLPSNVSPTINLELALDPSRFWVSPTVATSFLSSNIANLWLEGIGMYWNESGLLDTEEAELKFENLGKNFEGINEKPLTPADIGLLRSYFTFAKAYEQLSKANGDKKQMARADKLIKYIQPYLNE